MNSYIKQNIKQLRLDNNLSQTQFGELFGISRDNVSSYERSTDMKIELIQEIAKKFNISLDEFIGTDLSVKNKPYVGKEEPVPVANECMSVYQLKTDHTLEDQRIPLFEFRAAAGLTQLFNDHPNILNYIQIPNLPKCDGAIFANGNSMYPLVQSGDIVIYKRLNDIKSGIIYGEMYILSIVIDGEMHTLIKFVKKSELGEEYIQLVSQNTHHAPRDVHMSKVGAMALVKASIRYNTMS